MKTIRPNPGTTNYSWSTSRITGILFVSVMIFWGIGYVLIDTQLSGPDYLQQIYPSKARILFGVLFEILEIVAVLGIAVLLFPVFQQFNEHLARGYLTIRIIESVMLATAAISALILISVSQLHIESSETDPMIFQWWSKIIIELRHKWSFVILTPFYSIAALTLNYMLFKTRLVPRFLSIWGLSAAMLVLINQILIVLINHKLQAVPGALMGLNEIVLGFWLISNGLKTS